MKNKRIVGTLVYLIVMALLMSWSLGLFGGGKADVPYSQVVELFRTEQVKSFTVQDRTIYLELYSPIDGETEIATTMADPESFRSEMHELFLEQTDKGILLDYDFVPETEFSPFDIILPLIMAGIVLLFVWAMFMGRMNAQNPMNSFGRARTVLGVPDGKKVTFADVAGADEEKEELAEVVDFLRNPAKYTEI